MFGIVWAFLFLKRKDLRTPMLWTAAVYILFSWVIVSIWFFVSHFAYFGQPIVPYYWFPHTLFNLGNLTGFAGIEDILFLVFIGGIATCIYEYIYKKKIKVKRTYRPHTLAFFSAFIAFFIFVYFWPINLIYAFIFSNFIGAIVLLVQRRDLIIHSLIGSLSFLITYFIVFMFFLAVFPNFITQFYNLTNLTGIMILHIPLEEYLYALSFGLMWAPLYEYANGESN